MRNLFHFVDKVSFDFEVGESFVINSKRPMQYFYFFYKKFNFCPKDYNAALFKIILNDLQ